MSASVASAARKEPGLLAPGGRRLTYLRLSAIDRCNLRCLYCMPPEGVLKLGHADILTYEEMLRLAEIFAGLGGEKIRITGGEPLVRRDLTGFIARLGRSGLFRRIRLTTNGLFLPALAGDLKAAGVEGVNLSLNALTPAVYAVMAGLPAAEGRDKFRQAWAGFEAALDHGLTVKINCVPIRGLNETEWAPLAALALRYPIEVRFIEHMPIGRQTIWSAASCVPSGELLARLRERLPPLSPLAGPDPHAPARLYKPEGAPGAVGFISPMSDHFCGLCNRLRLTADGKLKPCLLTESEINIGAALRRGAGDDELRALFQLAASLKPLRHGRGEGFGSGENRPRRDMSLIGG
ncbi:MAG: GTP 3',8-cyclase MoaA [Candidatus Adiutrix sp.]|jgi:cyclic pyranopterin phosphate synthase|nr:GTP 3',8-cyclase MoaA [Candidatus Adiutrix sp.]